MASATTWCRRKEATPRRALQAVKAGPDLRPLHSAGREDLLRRRDMNTIVAFFDEHPKRRPPATSP